MFLDIVNRNYINNNRNRFHFRWLNPPINPYLYSPSQSKYSISLMGIMTLILNFRNEHRNKIISVTGVSPYSTGIITERILCLSLFLQLKICLQGQIPRLGGVKKVEVYRGYNVQKWKIFLWSFLEISSHFCNYFWE